MVSYNNNLYDDSSRVWLFRHRIDFDKFILKYFDLKNYDLIIKFLYWKYPVVGKSLVSSNMLSNFSRINFMMNIIFSSPKIIYIGGARGTGKSADAAFLAEKFYNKGYKVYYYMIFKCPKFASIIFDLSKTVKPCVVIIDESAITSSSRDSAKGYNEALTRIIPVLRHKDMWFIIISQHSAMTDINFLRLVDIKFFKPMSDDMVVTERDSVIKHPAIELLIPPFLSGQDWTDEVLFVYRDTFMRLKVPLPLCWTDQLSKSFSDISESELISYVQSLYLNHGWTLKHILTFLRSYGLYKTEQQVKLIVSQM